MYIFSQTLVRPKAASPAGGSGSACRRSTDAPHWSAGSTTRTGVGGGRWLQLRRTRGAGNAPPEAAAPPAQPASPPGSLARSGHGQGRGRGSAVASRGETAPSPHRAQCPQSVSLVIPSPRGRTPSLERWCGLPRSLQTAGAFSGQALFGARASRPAGVLRGKGPGSGCLL